MGCEEDNKVVGVCVRHGVENRERNCDAEISIDVKMKTVIMPFVHQFHG